MIPSCRHGTCTCNSWSGESLLHAGQEAATHLLRVSIASGQGAIEGHGEANNKAIGACSTSLRGAARGHLLILQQKMVTNPAVLQSATVLSQHPGG